MNIAVRYYTRSGNTKKLAEAVAKAVHTEAKDVTEPLAQKADILFLGCSYYGFDIDEAVKEFIQKNKKSIGKIVCIGTSAMMKSMRKPVLKIAQPLGITVADEEYHCRGKFGLLHKNRPDAKDIAGVIDFAKKMTE